MDKNKIWERETNKKKKVKKKRIIQKVKEFTHNAWLNRQIIFYAKNAKILPHNNYSLLSLQSTSIV